MTGGSAGMQKVYNDDLNFLENDQQRLDELNADVNELNDIITSKNVTAKW